MKRSKILLSIFFAVIMVLSAIGFTACSNADGRTRGNSEYTVTFDPNGGSLAGANTEKTVNGKLLSLPSASRLSYDGNVVFDGWYTSATGGTEISVPYAVNKNATVYAHWLNVGDSIFIGRAVTVTFHVNDDKDSVFTIETNSYGQLADDVPAVDYANHVFNGWYTEATGGIEVRLSQLFDADTDLYAHWTEKVAGESFCLVGDVKYALTKGTPADNATMLYSVSGVEMNAGDAVQFYIDGELVSAWPSGTVWNGLASTSKASSFIAARAGTFEFNISWYEADGTNDATWTLRGDDGEAPDLPETNVTLKFTDATVTIAFDLPSWATSTAYVYVYSGSKLYTGSWPGAAMTGGNITIAASIADCEFIISFKEGEVDKQTFDTDCSVFADGGTYLLSVGAWGTNDNSNKFTPTIKQA